MLKRLVLIEGVNVHQMEVAQMNAELDQGRPPWILNIHKLFVGFEARFLPWNAPNLIPQAFPFHLELQ